MKGGSLDPVAMDVVSVVDFTKYFVARSSRAVHDGTVSALCVLDAAGIIDGHLDTAGKCFLDASKVPRLAPEII